MADRTVGFAEKHGLSVQLGFGGLFRIQLAINTQLGGWREVQEFLELGHEMHLAATFQYVDAFFRGDYRIPVEVGGALLKLSEIFDASERSLRAEQTLDVHATQGRRVDTMTELLRTNVPDLMRARVRMAIRVAVETGDATAGARGAPVLSLVELLLRERSEQQTQALQLLGI